MQNVNGKNGNQIFHHQSLLNHKTQTFILLNMEKKLSQNAFIIH